MQTMMNVTANNDEVRLRKGVSFKERLILGGFGLGCFIITFIGFSAAALKKEFPFGGIVWALIGCLILAAAILARNVVWIITPDGILIGKQRMFGRLSSRMIRRAEVAQMRLQKDDRSTEFRLAFTTSSGDTLTSPRLPDITQVRDTTLRVARILALPEPSPIDNPLDAFNAEIRLGEPIKLKTGEGSRLLIVLLACVLSFPFAHALWHGELSALGATVWTLGLVVAAVLFRYAHRMSGSHWVIRSHDIRVERLSVGGKPEAETIRGDDIETIDVRSDSESDRHNIVIKLYDNRSINSPSLPGTSQAHAVRGEIVRRLNIPQSSSKPAG